MSTASYSFNLPTVGASSNVWGSLLNTNWEKVDDLLDGSLPVSGIDIDGGSVDGTPIGAATPSTGSFTTLGGTLTTAAQPNITSVGTLSALTVSGTLTGNVGTFSGPITATTANLTGAVITSAAPQLLVIDSDSGINVQYKANNASGLVDVDPDDLVANSTYLVRVDGATVGTFGPTGLDLVGDLDADTVSGDMLATQAEAEAGVVANKVMTPLQTAQAIAAQVPAGSDPGFNDGQEWSNPSRSIGTTYQNTTGAPIQVVICYRVSSNNQHTFEVSTDGVTFVPVVVNDTNIATLNVNANIMPGDYYRLRNSGGGSNAVVSSWAELS